MPSNTLGWAALAIFGLSGVLLGALSFVVYRYREARGTGEFAALLILTSIWSLSAATKVVAPIGIEQVLVSMEIVYGVLFAVAFLTFAAEYTGQSFHHRRLYGVAVAVYLLVVLVSLATNPIHELLWAGLGETVRGFHHVVFVDRGLLYWALIGVSYAIYGAGVYYLLDLHLRSRFNTSALLLIVVGGLVPILVNLGSLVDEGPVPGLDYTPFGLAVMGLATTAAIHRDLFAIVPIARDTAVEYSSEGMVILDSNRRIRDSNPTAKRLFPALTASAGDVVTEALPADAVTFDREEPQRSEAVVPVAGEERTVAITTAPISDGAHHLGWTLVASDVTEQKRRERHLELVARVLRHNMSNEITIIQGQTEILRAQLDDVDGDVDAHLDTIVESGRRIVKTSGKVRTIQEIVTDDRGALPTNLGRYVESVVSRLREAHPDATIEVDEADVWVESTTGLGPALENLVENAIVHNDSDAPWVSVEVTVGADAVTVAVADDGPGIPPSERRILDEGETPLSHSSGVGLWLVYRYVERSGRNLTFTRSQRGGSRVSFTLDRADAPDEPR